ncbi:MAG: glycosyltransferase family 4 protein [Anaerolineae bacterium]
MKVAFLSFDFGEYCIRLASALTEHADVMLLLPEQLASLHMAKLDPAVTFRPFHKPRLRQPVQQLLTALRIVRTIRDYSPDLIHFQHGHMWFNLALPLLARYPLVVTMHDVQHHAGDSESHIVPQSIMDIGYHRANEVIVHAQRLRDLAADRLSLPLERLHVIPHVLIGEDGQANGPRDDGVSVLFFGRIWGYKGLEYLIRAEPIVTAAVPEAHFVIAGEGEDFERYRRMMAHPDRFTVINEYVPDAVRADLFRQAAVVTLPYVEASQSGVIPVAYTAGKPVIATTVGGLPEMVADGETGYLVPPRDEQALAQAIITVLRDADRRWRMGDAARRRIHEECGPEVVARQTIAVYEEALAATSRPRVATA